MQHSTSCLTKCEDTLYRNLKDHLPAIALAHHNTAFNSAMKYTPFEAMYGLRAKTITEAETSLRLHITAEEGTGLTDSLSRPSAYAGNASEGATFISAQRTKHSRQC